VSRLSRWIAATYVRLLCSVPGLRAAFEEMYARGYADGRAAEATALLQKFARLEGTAPPLLH
jgi:hypothetical protein